MLRPLVMDFAADPRALQVKDQFMCGPALMVTPVTTCQERMRSVYLPTGSSWFDFWTGSAAVAGAVQAPAPYDAIPVHVRGGSIVPMGPELAYTSEKPADPVTLWVYGGANGSFSLYEDDGSTYGYEKGAFSRIPLTWNDATRTLTIGKREGTFPGMLAMRTFQVVLVTAGKAVAFSFTPTADKTVPYTGEEVAVPIP
jgi:alpha-D-xyloside xylohydrolase